MSDAMTRPVSDEPESRRRLLVEVRVREVVANYGAEVVGLKIWVTPEFLDRLEREVAEIVESAVARCAANKRAKLRAQDV